jgi:TonB-dependent starch-binding outer membrane protein SusC
MKMRNLVKVLMLPLLLLVGVVTFAQDKTVSGKVTDAKDGSPVQGATVTVKGGKAGTQTKADGTFILKVPASATTLVVSSVGFSDVELAISGGALNASLVATAGNLNDVVVIGYGSTKRKDVTGAVTTITSKDFVKGAIVTPEQLIAGKVAGLSVTPNGGAPGSGSVIRIRGGASINGSNDPLIVIDGVPVDAGGVSGSANILNLINPNDIESFNVLKDASATAIYGSRASNGVLIVTTKKGKSGKPQYNFNTLVGIYTPSGQVDVLDPDQFRAFVNAGGSAQQRSLLGNARTNWQDEIYKTALSTDNNISVSGAIKKVPYRVSAGYLNQDGILKTGNFQRTSLGLNLSPKFFNDALRVDINLKGSATTNRFANEGAIGAAIFYDPTQPVFSGGPRFGGYREWLDPASATGLLGLAPLNPVGLLMQRDDRSNVQRSIGNIALDYKIPGIDGLRANLNLGYDVSQGRGNVVVNDSAAMSYRRFKDASNVFHGGVNTQYNQRRQNLVGDFYLNYVKETKFGKFDITAGYSYQDWKTTTDNFNDVTFNGTIVNTPNFPKDIQQNRLIGVYGRFNYSYKGKYLLTATMRRDGSSRFAPENRWGSFPSAAAAWRLKEESFLRNVKAINELKLRVGFGITGQQDGIGNYAYLGNYALSGNQSMYQFGNTFFNMWAPLGYNPNLKWEQTQMTNVGIDFALFDNRITGSIEYYRRDTKDLLNAVNQSAGANFTNLITANVGTLRNEGAEFTLNTGIIRKKDLSLDFGFNITYNKNTITRLTLTDDPNFPGNIFGGISGGTGSTILVNQIGFPRGAFLTYKQVYDKNQRPIDGLVEDRNRDGIINDRDRAPTYQVDPLVFMGFNANLVFKRWNAGFVARANMGNYIYNNVFSNTGVRRSVLGQQTFLGNASTEVLRSNLSGTSDVMLLSDYWLQDGSFLRMDNINIGYNVGKVINGKANLRITANVQNAFVITKYQGLDPEIFGGIDNNLYPRPRVFVLGVNIDF